MEFWELGKIYALLTKRDAKMAGYWPSSFFVLLWDEMKLRSIKMQKKNEANIQLLYLEQTSLVNKEVIKRLHQRISLLWEQSGQSQADKIDPSCPLG